MGQEESVMVDDSVPPTVLKERSLDAIADYIVKKDACKIVVMVCVLCEWVHVFLHEDGCR